MTANERTGISIFAIGMMIAIALVALKPAPPSVDDGLQAKLEQCLAQTDELQFRVVDLGRVVFHSHQKEHHHFAYGDGMAPVHIPEPVLAIIRETLWYPEGMAPPFGVCGETRTYLKEAYKFERERKREYAAQ